MVIWQEGDVLTNGIRIHYHRTGGDKPPIVLLHGITDDGLCWPSVAEALVDDYDLIGVDARGHGQSEKPESEDVYSREEHAKDVAGLIEALRLVKPAVFGHSMGAGTATALASSFPDVPGVLVLEDPPWRKAEDSPEGLAEAQNRQAEWKEKIAAYKKLTPEQLRALGKSNNPHWADIVFNYWIDAQYAVSENVVGYMTNPGLDWEEAVARIQCPTLVLTADVERGAIVTPETAMRAQNNPNISVAHIADSGHCIRREQFEAYMAAVRAFLAESYPAA